MLYQLCFELTFVAIRKNSQSQFYYFESDLKPQAFSDLIFRFEPLMPRTVRINSYPTHSDCVIGFVDFQEENEIDIDPTHIEMLEYLRHNLVESAVTHHLVAPKVYGTVITFDPSIDKPLPIEFDPSNFTPHYFSINDEYTVYDRVEFGASALFEYVVQNLDTIKDFGQILYYFLAATKIYRDLTKNEEPYQPVKPLKNARLMRLNNMKLAVADSLNIDFESVHIKVLEARINGPYMIVTTDQGEFEVTFNPDEELISISPSK